MKKRITCSILLKCLAFVLITAITAAQINNISICADTEESSAEELPVMELPEEEGQAEGNQEEAPLILELPDEQALTGESTVSYPLVEESDSSNDSAEPISTITSIVEGDTGSRIQRWIQTAEPTEHFREYKISHGFAVDTKTISGVSLTIRLNETLMDCFQLVEQDAAVAFQVCRDGEPLVVPRESFRHGPDTGELEWEAEFLESGFYELSFLIKANDDYAMDAAALAVEIGADAELCYREDDRSVQQSLCLNNMPDIDVPPLFNLEIISDTPTTQILYRGESLELTAQASMPDWEPNWRVPTAWYTPRGEGAFAYIWKGDEAGDIQEAESEARVLSDSDIFNTGAMDDLGEKLYTVTVEDTNGTSRSAAIQLYIVEAVLSVEIKGKGNVKDGDKFDVQFIRPDGDGFFHMLGEAGSIREYKATENAEYRIKVHAPYGYKVECSPETFEIKLPDSTDDIHYEEIVEQMNVSVTIIISTVPARYFSSWSYIDADGQISSYPMCLGLLSLGYPIKKRFKAR